MGYNISALEGQNSGRDWPLIVTAVECSVCGAQPGEMCRSVGSKEGPTAASPFTNRGATRIDWHAERKQAAAHAWYTREQTAKQPEEVSDTEQGKEAATDAAVGAIGNQNDAAASVVESSDTTKSSETLQE
jgi:hypothetical protein